VTLTGGDTVDAGAVVVAAGCDSAGLGGLPAGILPPVRPVKGHILRLRGPSAAPLLARTVRALVHGRSTYLVPRSGGRLVVGATVEERGFDRTVQAGAVHALLADAREIVPGIDEMELAECAVGLRPATPDGAPAVGWSGLPGLLAATGHFRNGILLAPITGAVVADLLTGGGPGAFAAFGPERFG
jgi:glycine oxidase